MTPPLLDPQPWEWTGPRVLMIEHDGMIDG
jgi:hypothetical protein